MTETKPEAVDPPRVLKEISPEAWALAWGDDDDLALGPDGEPLYGDDPYEDGFCSDDVYAEYLKRQYLERHAKKKKDRASEQAALSYARQRMIGPTEPYFGAIPVVSNPRIDKWIHYFKTSGRREFMKWLVRGESVRPLVQPILKESGIPLEFFYLAMVESGFSNRASSKKRATGTWQFMQGTARNYGLVIDHWVDERRDPVKSTIAAASYLKDLYDRLGDWHLAMAAYNAGPGKVRKAIRAAGTKDFWKLAETSHLPKETKNYVPKVLAAVLLAADAKAHGFDFKEAISEETVPDTEVLVRRPIQISELAGHLGVPAKVIRAWNPELIHDVTPPGRAHYALRLAAPYALRWQEIESRLARIDVQDVKLHEVKRGDTLRGIARRYNVPVRNILSLNPQLEPSRLKVGLKVAVPVPSIVLAPGRPDAA